MIGGIGGVDDGIWYSPGYFPADGEPARVIGGSLDGDRRVWPHSGGTIRYRPPVDVPVGSHVDEIYTLYRCVHVPGPGREGPAGVEWVWMTTDAFLWATEGHHR